jgi:hypothetical protein
MLRKMFNEPNVPFRADLRLEDGNSIDLGNFRLVVRSTPAHPSANARLNFKPIMQAVRDLDKLDCA